MLFVVVFGFNAQDDLIGAGVGHLYYFSVDIVPKIPETYELRVLKAPNFLTRICSYFRIHDYGQFDDPNLFGGNGWFFDDGLNDDNVLRDGFEEGEILEQ